MEDANTQNQCAAERQLRPASVGDLARHFIGNHHRAQRINPGRHRVENEQGGQSPIVAQLKMGAEESPPQEARNGPQTENQNRQDQKHQP